MVDRSLPNGSVPPDVRIRAEWMRPSDDVILEMLEEYGNLTPQVIEEKGGPVQNYAGRRCRLLTRYGLVERLGTGLYGITQAGQDYLAGNLDASELTADGEEE